MSAATPREIATDALTGYALGADISREDVWQLIVEIVEADRAQRGETDPNDYVVNLTTGVAIKLESSRIVRNFSPELHAEDPEAIVFYAEAHGQEIR